MPTPEVQDIVPTFFVADVRKSIDWYERILGFHSVFVLGAPGRPAEYAGVELGPVRLHLAQHQAPTGMIFKGACYLRLVRGVDEYIAAILSRGQPLAASLKDHDYGMREATVRDPDGNDLYIGQAIQVSGG